MSLLLDQLGIDLKLLVTQLIGFLILMAVLHRVFTTKVFGILDERRDNIQATYDQLDRDRKAMETTRREYEARLAGIEAEARERIQTSIKEGQTLRDNIVGDAEKQAESIKERGRSESERERQKAFLEMRQQMVSLAVMAAGKVVGESLDETRHAKLVNDFIASVGSGSVVESGRGVSGNAIGSTSNGATPA